MTTRELLRLLCDGQYHSGEELGEHFGVSRTAIWKHLKKLEQQGIPLEAVRGRGYRVSSSVKPLEGAAIVNELDREARRLLSRLFVEESIPSTNALLLDRFAQGAGHAEVALAEVQTAGRGRRGRAWSSRWGQGVYLSQGWRFSCGVASLEGLSLAIGVVIAEVLRNFGVPAELKWPNDILINCQGEYQKLGGILVEIRGDAEGPCDVVAGIGLNMDSPDLSTIESVQPVAGIRQYSGELERNVLVAALLNRLLIMMPRFALEGFAAWQPCWNEWHAFSGRRVTIHQGEYQRQGVAGSVDVSGRLGVTIEGQLEWLMGGEISVRDTP